MKEKVKLYFEDLTFNTSYEFLEVGKNDKELEEIAEKAGIVLPSPDIAIFKGKYAFTDEENRNKCTLPKEEVEKALDTLISKAIDIDHYRKYTVGHWVEAYVDGNEIISYGAFWKSNFEEEYKSFKEKMSKGKVKISFEAWGEREFTNQSTGSYNLTNIHFAGGALLDKSEPAFKEAEVLEFAKVLEKNEEKQVEKARFYIYDTENIFRLVQEVKCPECSEQYTLDINMVDYENNKVRAKCFNCESIISVDLTPASKTQKKGRNVKKVKSEKSSLNSQKIITDLELEKINVNISIINKTLEEIGNMDYDIEDFKKRYNKNMEELSMNLEERIKELEQEVATLKTQVEEKTAELDTKTAELEKSNQVIDELKKESEDSKVKIEEIEASKADEIQKAKDESKTVTERRSELGDFAKDVSDEDLLNSDKYELLKAKKALSEKEAEIAEIKKGNTTSTSTQMVKGSTDKEKEDSISSKREGVQKSAFADDE